MILFTIILIVLVSSIFTPFDYWYRPRPFFRPRPHFGFGPRMRGPRPFGPMHGPMHGPMGRGPGHGPRI